MSVQIESWQDLAERTFHRGLSEGEVAELGLSFKSGKDFASLRDAMNGMQPESPFTYWSIILRREGIPKKHLEGNLSNEHGL